MKKNYFAFVLICAINCGFSQVKDSTSVASVVYIGVGLQSFSNININNKLSSVNLPLVPQNMPEFIIGINVFGKKYSGGLEYSSGGALGGKTADKIDYEACSFRGNFSYNLISKTKFAFTTGLNLAYTYTEFIIYNDEAVLDFNNLKPTSNAGYISLDNRRLFFGPAASLHLFKESKIPLRLNFAYEFGITAGTWVSDFVKIENSVNERGNNRFLFRIMYN
jgi:hypothetical protein